MAAGWCGAGRIPLLLTLTLPCPCSLRHSSPNPAQLLSARVVGSAKSGIALHELAADCELGMKMEPPGAGQLVVLGSGGASLPLLIGWVGGGWLR